MCLGWIREMLLTDRWQTSLNSRKYTIRPLWFYSNHRLLKSTLSRGKKKSSIHGQNNSRNAELKEATVSQGLSRNECALWLFQNRAGQARFQKCLITDVFFVHSVSLSRGPCETGHTHWTSSMWNTLSQMAASMVTNTFFKNPHLDFRRQAPATGKIRNPLNSNES